MTAVSVDFGVAPLAAAATMVALVRVVIPPRRRLGARLRPFAALGRSRLGTGYADVSVARLVHHDDRALLVRLFGPSARDALERLLSAFDLTSHEQLEMRLRHAGLSGSDPFQYRLRQLGWTVAGVSTGVALGVLILGSATGTLLLMASFGFPAATMQRNRIQRAIDIRTMRMRTEVPTVTQLLAVHIRTGRGPVEAIRSVCRLGRGPLVGELREALGWMSGGITPADAYRRLAETTAEPSAARLYRLLAATSHGGDIGQALLAVGDDLRSERRDEVARAAVKRRTAMLVPLLLLIAPVMVLFVGAALPSLVLGPVR